MQNVVFTEVNGTVHEFEEFVVVGFKKDGQVLLGANVCISKGLSAMERLAFGVADMMISEQVPRERMIMAIGSAVSQGMSAARNDSGVVSKQTIKCPVQSMGKTVPLQAVIEFMDDGLKEEIYNEFKEKNAPKIEAQAFLELYRKRHLQKFGTPFGM